jgi:hypothetical protein
MAWKRFKLEVVQEVIGMGISEKCIDQRNMVFEGYDE